MKRFSQFLGIRRGKDRFKQAPNAVLVQGASNPYSDCTKYTIVITGDESFNFQTSDNTVYYKNNQFANIPNKNVVYAECTHFKWGKGAVIAQMNNGEFIFNYTASTGIGTGNISFKDTSIFTSSSVAKEWFKTQVANGTPVTITVYIKN